MSGRVEFDYRLVGTGWSEARFAVGEEWVGLTASYLDDALGDLLLAVRRLIEGDDEARASWAEEPGEYRWLFSRAGDQVRVRVLSFPGLWSDAADSEGEALIDVTCSLEDLIEGIAAGARRVLESHGEEGYREKWVDHDFPLEHLEALEAA